MRSIWRLHQAQQVCPGSGGHASAEAISGCVMLSAQMHLGHRSLLSLASLGPQSTASLQSKMQTLAHSWFAHPDGFQAACWVLLQLTSVLLSGPESALLE